MTRTRTNLQVRLSLLNCSSLACLLYLQLQPNHCRSLCDPWWSQKIKWEPPRPLSYAKHILRKLRDTNKGHAMPYNTKIWRKLRAKSGWSNRRVERDQADVWNEGRSKHSGKGAEGEKRKLFETHKLYWWLKIFDAWQLSRNCTYWTYFPPFTQMLDFKHKLISFFRDYLVD